jgi:hypothetical protein
MSGRVRTYLDPDARGPLPRYSFADDSDSLAAARTIERPPMGATQEIIPADVLEIVDAPQRPASLAPVGYDVSPRGSALLADVEPMFLPRRRLGGVVVAVVAVAGVVLLLATIQVRSGERDRAGGDGLRAAAVAPAPKPTQVVPAPGAPDLAPAPVHPTPTSVTTGTLRFDATTSGHRVWVDDVLLSTDAAIVKCGTHRVRVGSLGTTRWVDVPCGGEVTLGR